MSALTPAPRTRRAILASAGGSRAPRAPPAPSQRAQRARAEARQRASRGSGAPHGPPRCRATPAQGHRRSTCTPGHEEGLYVVLRPAQSRPTRSARAWLACSGHSSWRRPPRGWRSAAHTASSTQVACLASGGALLGAKTHPVTPRMLGARVVTVLGPPVVVVGARGGVVQRTYLAIDPMCVPRRGEVLYVLLRPTQSRPVRSARTWWPCSGRS